MVCFLINTALTATLSSRVLETLITQVILTDKNKTYIFQTQAMTPHLLLVDKDILSHGIAQLPSCCVTKSINENTQILLIRPIKSDTNLKTPVRFLGINSRQKLQTLRNS